MRSRSPAASVADALDGRHRLLLAHVEAVITAEQDTLRADQLDEKLEYGRGVANGIEAETAQILAGRPRQMFALFTHGVSAVQAPGQYRQHAA